MMDVLHDIDFSYLSPFTGYEDFASSRKKSFSLSDESWIGDLGSEAELLLQSFESFLDSDITVNLPNSARVILGGLTDDRDETAMNRLLDSCVDADAQPFEGIEAADLSSLLLQFEKVEANDEGQKHDLECSDDSSCTSESLEDILVLSRDLGIDVVELQDDDDTTMLIADMQRVIDTTPNPSVSLVDEILVENENQARNESLDENEIDVGQDPIPAEILKVKSLSEEPKEQPPSTPSRSRTMKSILNKEKVSASPSRTPPPEMIEKIKSSNKRKSTIMLPMSVPSKRGRGHAVPAQVNCRKRNQWSKGKPLDEANTNDMRLDHDYCARESDDSNSDRLVVDSNPSSRASSRPGSPLSGTAVRGPPSDPASPVPKALPLFIVSSTGLVSSQAPAYSSMPGSPRNTIANKITKSRIKTSPLVQTCANFATVKSDNEPKLRSAAVATTKVPAISATHSTGQVFIVKGAVSSSETIRDNRVANMASTASGYSELVPPIVNVRKAMEQKRITEQRKLIYAQEERFGSVKTESSSAATSRSASPSSCSNEADSMTSGDIVQVDDMEIDELDFETNIRQPKKISLAQYRNYRKNRPISRQSSASPEPDLASIPLPAGPCPVDRKSARNVETRVKLIDFDGAGRSCAIAERDEPSPEADGQSRHLFPSPVRRSPSPCWTLSRSNSSRSISRSPTRSLSPENRRAHHGSNSGHRASGEREARRRRRSKTDRSISEEIQSRDERPRGWRKRVSSRTRRDSLRSRSRSKSRSRSSSPETRRVNEKRREQLTKLRIEERRIVYVGALPSSYSKRDLEVRFSRFGAIEEISLHRRDRGDNYGFVTYRFSCDAFDAISKGNNDPADPHLDLCFGGRREFCKADYADLDGKQEIEEELYSELPQQPVTDFDQLLRQFQKFKKTTR